MEWNNIVNKINIQIMNKYKVNTKEYVTSLFFIDPEDFDLLFSNTSFTLIEYYEMISEFMEKDSISKLNDIMSSEPNVSHEMDLILQIIRRYNFRDFYISEFSLENIQSDFANKTGEWVDMYNFIKSVEYPEFKNININSVASVFQYFEMLWCKPFANKLLELQK